MKSNFMDSLSVNFLQGARNNDVIRNLQVGEQNLLMKSLQNIALKKSTASNKSAQLAATIQKDFKTQF